MAPEDRPGRGEAQCPPPRPVPRPAAPTLTVAASTHGSGAGGGELLSGWKLQANRWAGNIGDPTPSLSPHGPTRLRSVPAALQLAQRGPPATRVAQFLLLTR